jgi:PAS domain S-box-containing protein
MDDICKKIVEHSWHAVLTLNSRGEITYTNPAFTEIFGYTYEEVLNKKLITLIADDFKKIVQEKLENYNRQSTNPEATPPAREILSITALHQNGSLLDIELSFLVQQQNGRNNIIAFVRDLTSHRRLFRELKASRDSYWALSETTSDAILQINQDFTIQFANTAIKSIFGYSNEELQGKGFDLLFPPPVYKRHHGTFKKYFIIDDQHRKAKSLTNTIEILGQTRKGEIIPLEISVGNSRSVAGSRVLTCIVRDITERKKTERKLKYLAYHDRLTDLGNRDFFNISLDNFLTLVKRSENTMGALLFLDLDGFKKVNDTLGHNIGDMILIECARRLSNCLRESDIVYRFSDDDNYPVKTKEDLFRFGGDEFIILLTNLKKSTDAAVVAQKIIESVKRPYFVKEYMTISKINLGVSIGIAMIPANGHDPTSLISSADVAMYKAKELGNRYMYFTQEMNKRATERLLIENGIRNALENNTFEMHYQPMVADDGTIKGMEALIRWPHPERGYILGEDY